MNERATERRVVATGTESDGSTGLSIALAERPSISVVTVDTEALSD